MAAQSQTADFSVPLPRALNTRIFIRLSAQAKAITVSLTTASADETSASKPMGSFVYALPDRFNPQQPLATTLFSYEATVEFTTRLAKLLARRARMPVYVTNSMSLADAPMGGTVEEEMDALKSVVDVALKWLRDTGVGSAAVNGDVKA